MRTTGCVQIVWITAISVVALTAVGPAGEAPTAFGENRPASTADVRITKFHLVETKDGKTLWEVWGDRGEVFDKEGIAKVMKVSNPVTVMLYSEQGKLTARSDRATVNMRTKDIRLERNVTATSEQGNSLQTQSLDWSAKDRRVSTRLPVTLVKGGFTSSGVGMEAETDLERVRFLSRVRSHVMSEGGGPEHKGRPGPRNGGTQ
ncbi:Lipopolysaccharide-assembly, LptC-related [Candidatus Methylomirabilis lanthanidiphila]|uniref:Lipopolysaccharide-assembly, LptC-related n=1 Tax=Candidatus Methylomirabilis lanthanidiphila TaxID=2211376 RepID=A0A564ZF18_9BACT|nr:LPS export ABC transporter periplasmic protein LptC [Candidatus Methylomirabilis lanthanidiphila]VUZ83854.1 Lipopolysaccharide-assembly, LptC-related [Candidatus Methylomirabilis lanthanidiphila]